MLTRWFLPNTTEQSLSWEANNFAADHEFPNILWNLMIHFHVHRRLPLVPVLSQISPVHTHALYFFKINFNTIFPSTSRYSKRSFFRLSHQNPAHSPSPLDISQATHSSLYCDSIMQIIMHEAVQIFNFICFHVFWHQVPVQCTFIHL
jgi:hypothetical protein